MDSNIERDQSKEEELSTYIDDYIGRPHKHDDYIIGGVPLYQMIDDRTPQPEISHMERSLVRGSGTNDQEIGESHRGRSPFHLTKIKHDGRQLSTAEEFDQMNSFQDKNVNIVQVSYRNN